MYRRILCARSGTDVKMPRANRSRSILENQSSTWFSQDGRERQHRVEAVERLNRRFLIDGEHRCVIWRIDVQPDHVRRLRLEVRVVRLHVALEPMRLQPGALPCFGDEIVMNLQQTP